MAAEYGDVTHWIGDDDRDLQQEDPACQSCGAQWNEPCEPDCLCRYCVNARARKAAIEFDALHPKEVA